MPKILIVGAGQSGLQLGLSLLEHDYDVTLMSARTPEEIRGGWVTSTQAMYPTALQYERDHGLNLWDDEAVNMHALNITVAGEDGGKALEWCAPWSAGPAQSIDQRVKMASWLELFDERGGNLVTHGVTTADVNALSPMYDLTIVAAGRGELVQLFDRDPSHSPYDRPQRSLGALYAHGVGYRAERPGSTDMAVNMVPGVGELIQIPGYTLSGNCVIMFFLGVPGGPLDCWQDRPGPDELRDRILEKMREFVPWEYERCRDAEPTDSRAALTGAVTPVVRHPVGDLPSGSPVLGMADVVVTNDPVTGQGSNTASKCAESYLDSILRRGAGPFDRAWMQGAFDTFWENTGRHVTKMTNALLAPPPEHFVNVFGAADQFPEVAQRWTDAFDTPSDFENWFFDPELSAQYLSEVARKAG